MTIITQIRTEVVCCIYMSPIVCKVNGSFFSCSPVDLSYLDFVYVHLFKGWSISCIIISCILAQESLVLEYFVLEFLVFGLKNLLYLGLSNLLIWVQESLVFWDFFFSLLGIARSLGALVRFTLADCSWVAFWVWMSKQSQQCSNIWEMQGIEEDTDQGRHTHIHTHTEREEKDKSYIF